MSASKYAPTPTPGMDGRSAEERIAVLEQGYHASLELIEKLENLILFQDRVDVTSTVGQIWESFRAEMQKTIDIEVCALFLVDENTHEFEVSHVSPFDQEAACRREIDLQIEYGTFSWIINRRQPALIPALSFSKKKTVLLLPLCTFTRTPGVVLVISTVPGSAMTRERMKLLAMLAKQWALVLDNTLLYERLKQDHESLQSAQERIIHAEKMAAIGRLTSGACHELLNPLTILSGRIQLLLMDKKLPRTAEKSFGILQTQAKRIEKIVKGLLQFSHLAPSERAHLHVNPLVESALDEVRGRFGFDRISVILALEEGLPCVKGDRRKLVEVLSAVMVNAVEAMPRGGTLRVSTRRSVGDVKENRKPAGVDISVDDTGCGIAAGVIDKIFEPFLTTKGAAGSVGLGLAVSHGIVQEHGGSIAVESEEGRGSRFVIRLPADDP